MQESAEPDESRGKTQQEAGVKNLQFCDLCNKLCDQIPQKIFKGFQNENVNLTCLDANKNLIVAGSNVGHLYIFNRVLKKLSTIKGQDENSSIKLSRNLFYDQIAVGMSNGLVIVLQLPSPDPGYSKKLIEKSLKEIHKSRITCLEWSLNGGKLFSGDDTGLVMMILLDFENDVFDSTFVCCEDGGIMQMSFSGNYLAVSTKRRIILVDIPNDCSVKQLCETAEKSSFHSFGVVFDPFIDEKNSDTRRFSLYASRPDSIIMNLDDQGMVLDTLKFDADSTRAAPEIDVPQNLRNSAENSNFSIEFCGLKFFHSSILATTYMSNFYLIDVAKKTFIFKTNLFSNVKDFSCLSTTSEIFLLCGDRTILRFASTADDNLVCLAAPVLQSTESFGKNFLKKITNFSNLNPNFDGSSSGEINLSNSAMDLKNIFTRIRGEENFRSGFSTPECYFDENADSSSVNDDKDIDKPWILSPDSVSELVFERNDIPQTSNESKMAAFRDVSGNVKGLSLNLVPPTVESQQGFFSSLIDTVGGFGARTETGVQLDSESLKKGETKDNVKANVSVFRKLKKKTTRSQSPINLHPVDKLATPTEEQYSKNRFNPFLSEGTSIPESNEPADQILDNENQHESPSISRETLEKFLDSKLYSPDEQVPGTDTPADAQVVLQQQEADAQADAQVVSQQQGADAQAISETNSSNSDSISDVSCESNRPLPADFNTLLHLQLDIRSESSSSSRPTSNTDATLDSDEQSGDPWAFSQGSDIWNDATQSLPITCLSGTNNYVCCVDSRQNLNYTLTSVSSSVWQTSEDKADWICVSPNGKIIWRLLNGTALALVKPHKSAPKGSKWVEAAPNVISMTICDHTAWYLRRNGDIIAQTDLRADRPCFKARKIDCPYSVVHLACNNECLWALMDDGRILIRTGISPENHLGEDWVDVLPLGPNRSISLSLSEGKAWVLDDQHRLWFCDGLTCKNPLGTSEIMWQVSLPNSFRTQFLNKKKFKFGFVFALPTGVYLAYSKYLWFCRGALTGHQWNRTIPNSFDAVAEFRRLCVCNVFDESSDCIWLQRSHLNNELMAYQPKTKMMHSIPPCSDSDPVAMSSSTGVLWVLDKNGDIFIRHDVGTPDLPLGSDWQALDMTQLRSCDVEIFEHLCCSLESVWACDRSGLVYVRMGTAARTVTGLSAAWVGLERQPEHPIRRLFCSPDGNFVWALSDFHKVLVRYGITQDMPIGTHWITVDDLKASHLAVGFKSVWALTPDHQVHCRYGVDYGNPAGNYWKKIPGRLRSLSTTPANQLWGIDMDGRLLRHRIRVHSVCEKLISDKAKSEESDDFELI